MSPQPSLDAIIPPAASINAGVARRDITPPVGIYARNWGAAKHETAEGVHRPMTATVLAIRGNAAHPPLILTSIDAGWWQVAEDERFVRDGIIDALKLDPARVLLCCTHTHSGPSLNRIDADKPGGKMIESYLRHMRNTIADAARDALANLAPATLTWATGRCDLAANRDLPDPDADRSVCGWNPDETADDTLLVGRVTNASDRTMAVIVNYACHPTTLAWENKLISPDYIGAMREVIERAMPDGKCLFLQGASGELAPREQYTGDPAVADAHGRQLGYAVLSALHGMLPPRHALTYEGVVESGAPLAIWKRRTFDPPADVVAICIDVELPIKPLPSHEDLQHELDQCTDRALSERLRRKIRVVQTVGSGPTTRMPAWIWRIGDALIVAQPNETYSLFQRMLRKAFPNHAVAVVSLANGSCGYLSPPEVHDKDIYQAWQSPFAADALAKLTATCIDHMNHMIEE